MVNNNILNQINTMIFFNKTIRKAIDKQIKEIESHKNGAYSYYAIREMDILKKKLGL